MLYIFKVCEILLDFALFIYCVVSSRGGRLKSLKRWQYFEQNITTITVHKKYKRKNPLNAKQTIISRLYLELVTFFE